MSNGKGDMNRTSNWLAYRSGYEAIRWSSQKKTKKDLTRKRPVRNTKGL